MCLTPSICSQVLTPCSSPYPKLQTDDVFIIKNDDNGDSSGNNSGGNDSGGNDSGGGDSGGGDSDDNSDSDSGGVGVPVGAPIEDKSVIVVDGVKVRNEHIRRRHESDLADDEYDE